MKKVASILAMIFVIGWATFAHADDTIGESLDWLVLSRPSIAIEVVTKTSSIDGKNLKIQTELKKALKGQPPQHASYTRYWLSTAVFGEEDTARPPNGVEYLLFFNDQGEVTNAINLDRPSRKLGMGSRPEDVPFSTDFSIFKTRDTIMEAVERNLAELATDSANSSTPREKSKKVSVPLDSPVWSALYNGGTCYLMVPDRSQHVTERIIQYANPAYSDECNAVSQKPFEIKSAIVEQKHSVIIGCAKNDVPYPPFEMRMVFKIYDVMQQGDYEFRWGQDADALPKLRGIFTGDSPRCGQALKELYNKLPGIEEIPPTNAGGKPMIAKWRAECVADDRWGMVMAIYLNIAPKPDTPPQNAP